MKKNREKKVRKQKSIQQNVKWERACGGGGREKAGKK